MAKRKRKRRRKDGVATLFILGILACYFVLLNCRRVLLFESSLDSFTGKVAEVETWSSVDSRSNSILYILVDTDGPGGDKPLKLKTPFWTKRCFDMKSEEVSGKRWGNEIVELYVGKDLEIPYERYKINAIQLLIATGLAAFFLIGTSVVWNSRINRRRELEELSQQTD